MRRFFGIVGLCVTVVITASLVSAHGSPSSTSVVSDNACSSNAPCLTETNNGNGEGASATAVINNGLQGNTKFNSTGSGVFKAGVLGSDLSASGTFDVGVEGLSIRGFGLKGLSTTGTGVAGRSQLAGVTGTATHIGGVGVTGVVLSAGGIGVSGLSSGGGVGVNGSSAGYGVEGTSTGSSIGVFGSSSGASGVGVNGVGVFAGVEGVNTSSPSSVAIRATGLGGQLFVGHNSHGNDVLTVDDSGFLVSQSNIQAGGYVQGTNGIYGYCSIGCSAEGVFAYSVGREGLLVQAASNTTIGLGVSGDGADLFSGVNSALSEVFTLDDGGNIHIAGLIYTAGSCGIGCAPSNEPGRHVVSYAPRESEPSMEDFGEAQLVDGQAYVRLDPTFANVIDGHARYLVFITPEGDSHSLYVTQKSPAGFAVHESGGGRSTLAFSYRIVAKPYGESSPRLPTTISAPIRIKPPQGAHQKSPLR